MKPNIFHVFQVVVLRDCEMKTVFPKVTLLSFIFLFLLQIRKALNPLFVAGWVDFYFDPKSVVGLGRRYTRYEMRDFPHPPEMVEDDQKQWQPLYACVKLIWFRLEESSRMFNVKPSTSLFSIALKFSKSIFISRNLCPCLFTTAKIFDTTSCFDFQTKCHFLSKYVHRGLQKITKGARLYY